jgi:hypothetical protein
MKMKWQSGQPVDNGKYLCSVLGWNTPTILNYDKEGNFWYSISDTEYEISEVPYYMNLNDIPMPEGW